MKHSNVIKSPSENSWRKKAKSFYEAKVTSTLKQDRETLERKINYRPVSIIANTKS